MDQPLKEKKKGKPRILVAPLDWGLGHATRCIPIIKELLLQGCEVWLAGEGRQKELLKTEFPELPFLDLPGYRIVYAKTKKGLLWKMIQQGPQLRRAILYEHQWLKRMVKENHFDAVISDNRYGLYHSDIPCIFITHQLLIKSSAGKWTEKVLQKRNFKYINRFTECWVPDLEGENNLAGDLSHPPKKPNIPVRYISLLSRFTSYSPSGDGGKDHLLIILSGPEPQRTILENKIIKDISHYNGTAVIVRGLPGSASLIPSTNMLLFYNHLPAKELNDEMMRAEYIISRSGYSTVMDVMTLQKKSILIPTPGQTEQEYLGEYLMKKRMAITASQKDFSLTGVLSKAGSFTYIFPSFPDQQLMKLSIDELLRIVQHK
ncbi:MAG: glycosyl transferase family 28 [Chitinophagaceae bacterium]|nr:glycosyl transferase family 28 [Chitinophagaceae bacterium]